uniref:REF4-related 1 n=2 Tax=Macrostomum lignano TaxID=282301 RepID=A0A1I8I858_9PLAT
MVADFVQRVTAYPAVASAWQRAASCYDWALSASPSVRSAAGFTEGGLRRAAATAAPLLARFEPAVARLDRLACAQLLDRLEARCPAVKEATAQELVASARDAVQPTLMAPVNSAVAKAQSAKAYGLAKCTRLSEDSGELVVAWVDRCVDHYLPEDGEAGKERRQQQQQQSEAPEGIRQKLRRRLFSRVADFAVRLSADDGDDENQQRAAEADGVAAVQLAAFAAAAAAKRRARAASLAGAEFAAARLPDLETLPGAGRVVAWLSYYTPEQFLVDPFDPENRRLALTEGAASAADSEPSQRHNGECSSSER